MLRKLFLVPVLALFLLPAAAQAQFEQGNWTLELAGNGSNDQNFDTGQAAVNAEIGYLLTKELEVGLNQSVIWSDGGSDWNGATFAFADYHIDLDRWQPYVGANIGYTYGGNGSNSDSWYAGPEGGVKYFVNATTFIDFQITYEFNLDNGFDNGAFAYGLGIGFKW